MQDLEQLKVSVVVPFHNADSYLAQALESIAASSHRNIEVILINDGSTDGGGVTAKMVAARDSRFTYLANESNRRVSFCRNVGLREATGDFILFVDSDDRISADWIQNLLRTAVAEGADVVIGKAKRCRADSVADYDMKGLTRRGALAFGDIVFKDNAVLWNKLYSASIVRRWRIHFDEDLWIGEDLVFNYLVLGRAKRIYYSGEGFYYYRADSPSSIMRSSTPATRIRNLSRVLSLLVECSLTIETKNPGVLKKVAKDILVNAYRHNEAIDPSTMAVIRRVAPLMPGSVRLKVLLKSLRNAIVPQNSPDRGR